MLKAQVMERVQQLLQGMIAVRFCTIPLFTMLVSQSHSLYLRTSGLLPCADAACLSVVVVDLEHLIAVNYDSAHLAVTLRPGGGNTATVSAKTHASAILAAVDTSSVLQHVLSRPQGGATGSQQQTYQQASIYWRSLIFRC
jgi:hypothetical protein